MGPSRVSRWGRRFFDGVFAVLVPDSAGTGSATRAMHERYEVSVIGGYRQRGDSPDVSYVAVFGQNVQALYDLAPSDDAT